MKKFVMLIIITMSSLQLNGFKGATWSGRGYATTLKLSSNDGPEGTTTNTPLGYIAITNRLAFPVYIKAKCTDESNCSISEPNKPTYADYKGPMWLNPGQQLKYVRFDWGGPYELECYRSTNINNLKDSNNLQQISSEYALSVDTSASKIAIFSPSTGLCDSNAKDYLGIGKLCRTVIPFDGTEL